MPSFHELLQRRLRSDPGQPLVTYYDDATGERTELSVTTYANWVAKTAGVLTDDLGLDVGDRLRVDLPPHWLVPVFTGAALTVGLEPTDGDAEAVVGHGVGATLFCALLPFAVASREPVPDGAQDFGTLWPGQPDVYLGVPDHAAVDVAPDARRLVGEPADFLALLVGGGSLVIVRNAGPDRVEAITTSERADAAG